jgi:hypothetical protein
VSVSKLKKAFERLGKYFPEGSQTRIPARYLVTDGDRIYLHNESPEGPLDLTSGGQLTFGFFIDVEKARDKLLYDVSAEVTKRLEPQQMALSL